MMMMSLKEGIPIKKYVYDSFRTLHVNKDGTYTYKKAEEVYTRVREIAEQQGKSADLSQIYVDEMMGGRLDKKQRMFGTSTLARSLVGGTSQTIPSQHVDARFDELQQQLQEEREHRLRLEESLRVTNEMFQQCMRSQQSRISGSRGSDLPGDNP
ncbi:uncharacterized protein LOC131006896 [Salvia miltiorrhiza]|uniref:uncharacterized protein LOC131006896 n=1 Tax=Salvia miltiorrhiza TaxID=226208 RepID=UPI0025ABF566|nr:uncharacterized protein LOC131006896 [Salvia miltiorrhiza]